MGMPDYSHDGGRRFYCVHNGKNYYLACHKYYSNDKFDKDSTLLLVHNNPRFQGENFSYEYFSNEFCLYYKDNTDGMKNWMLYIHKQSNIEYYIPMFHRTKCSKFEFENVDDGFVLIKETYYNVYLYLNEAKKRDSNSFYIGATPERNKATKFKYFDVN